MLTEKNNTLEPAEGRASAFAISALTELGL